MGSVLHPIDKRPPTRGNASRSDPVRTAAALVWMNERFFNETLGREPFDDPDDVAETLVRIWSATIYR